MLPPFALCGLVGFFVGEVVSGEESPVVDVADEFEIWFDVIFDYFAFDLGADFTENCFAGEVFFVGAGAYAVIFQVFEGMFDDGLDDFGHESLSGEFCA